MASRLNLGYSLSPPRSCFFPAPYKPYLLGMSVSKARKCPPSLLLLLQISPGFSSVNLGNRPERLCSESVPRLIRIAVERPPRPALIFRIKTQQLQLDKHSNELRGVWGDSRLCGSTAYSSLVNLPTVLTSNQTFNLFIAIGRRRTPKQCSETTKTPPGDPPIGLLIQSKEPRTS